MFNISKTRKKPQNDASAFTDVVSLKAYGHGAAVSEVSIRSHGDDLVLETKITLKGGRTHVRNEGLTNYLENVVRDLTGRMTDRILAVLEAQCHYVAETADMPFLP